MAKRTFIRFTVVFLFCFSPLVYVAQKEAAAGPSPSTGENQSQGCKGSSGPHSCTACHKFAESKFRDLTGTPELKVLNYEMVAGLWQVLYENDAGQRNVLYASLKFDRIFYGQIIGRDGKNFTRDYMLKHAGKIDPSVIPVRDAAYIMGNRDAKNKIFVFDDLDCQYCARLHFELKRFLSDHNDYAAYVMLSPLPGHPRAEERSKAVHCLGSLQEKEAMVESIFKNILDNKKVAEAAPGVKCDTSVLDRVKHYATETLKVKGAPTMILPDGRVIDGFLSKKELEDILSNKSVKKSPKKVAKKGGAPYE